MAMSAMLHHEHDALQENPELPKVSTTNPEILRPHAGRSSDVRASLPRDRELFSLPANLLTVIFIHEN